jgi:hypothetical protein
MRAEILLLVALTFGGCAGLTGAPAAPRVDQVTFDRGAFALAYADLVNPMRAACKTTPDTADCVKLTLLDQQVRQAIIDAPKAAAAATPAGLDMSTLLPLIMKLAPLAAGM